MAALADGDDVGAVERVSPPVRRTGTVAIVFTDLVGSTELFASLGDEQADDIRRRHFHALRQAAQRHGGNEVKSLGDGLMLVFSRATAAVTAASAMQQAVELANEDSDHRLALRVGINVGDTIVDGGDYFGTAVVVASRLCDRAEGGEVLVSQAVVELVEVHAGFRFAPLASLSLKGLADPVQTQRLELGPGASVAASLPADRRSVPAHGTMPTQLRLLNKTALINRNEELAALDRSLASVRAGEHRLVLVDGEGGMGKSHVMAAFAQQAHAAGSIVLFGHCDETALLPYEPFAEALEGLVELLPTPVLRSQLGIGAAELVRIVPSLASRLPDIEVPLDRDADRYRLFESVRLLLTANAAAAPVVLVLDDLHLADVSTLSLLRHLARQAERLLIVAGYRDEEAMTRPLGGLLAELRRLPSCEPLTVSGLARDHVADLIEAWAGQRPTTGLAHRLWTMTTGNPLFIRELLRHLLSTGLLEIDEAGVRPTGPLDEIHVPESVKGILLARLNGLSPPCRRLLTMASVAGPFFDVPVLCRLLPDASTVLELVEEACAAGIVSPTTDGVGRFGFDHDLLRTSLEQSLATGERARIHVELADHLEALHHAGGHVSLAELAHHALQGVPLEGPQRALTYLERAARQAMSGFAFEEAAQLLEAALDVWDQADQPDALVRCRLLRRLGEAWWAVGDVNRARHYLGQAAAVAERAGSAEELAHAAIAFHGEGPRSMRVDFGEVSRATVALIEHALTALGDSDPRLRARLLGHLASALALWPDADRRLKASQEAVALARSVGDLPTLIDVLSRSLWAEYQPDNAARRRETAREIVKLGRRLGDAQARCFGLLNGAMSAFELGDLDAVARACSEIDKLALQTQDPYYAWFGKAITGSLTLLRGDLRDAQSAMTATFEESPELRRDVSFEDPALGTVAAIAPQLTVLRFLQGRLGELLPAIRSFAADLPAVSVWGCVEALALWEAGRADEARAKVHDLTQRDLEDLPRDLFWTTAVVCLAEVCERLDERDVADRILGLLLPLREQTHSYLGVISFGAIARSTAALAATAGRLEEAEELFRDALEINERIGGVWALALTRAQYARMLLARGSQPDVALASRLLTDAVQAAARGGWKAVSNYAHRVVDEHRAVLQAAGADGQP